MKNGNYDMIKKKKLVLDSRKKSLNKRKEDRSIRLYKFICCMNDNQMTNKRSFLVKNPRIEGEKPS